jgi:hypothetical protein
MKEGSAWANSYRLVDLAHLKVTTLHIALAASMPRISGMARSRISVFISGPPVLGDVWLRKQEEPEWSA